MKRRWWLLIILAFALLFLMSLSGCATQQQAPEKECPVYESTRTLIA